MALPRVRVLTPADLAEVPGCTECGFRVSPDDDWARAAQDRWALVGLEFRNGGAAPAYALVAVPDALPADHPLSGQRSDRDVAILLAVHVDGPLRKRGLARMLVIGLARRLLGRVQAIEAAGSRGYSSCQAPSAAWLEGIGFHHTEGMEWLPGGARRMRMDLNATVRWQPDLAQMVRRLVRLGPEAEPVTPEGAGRTARDAQELGV